MIIVEELYKYLKDTNVAIYNRIREVIPEGIIAGGAARQIFLNEPFGSTDIDFYMPTILDRRDVSNRLIQNYECYAETRNAVGYLIDGIKCQLIKKKVIPIM